jgi:hypothetical protein
MSATTDTQIRVSFARALRAVGTAVADVVGPSWWALGPDTVPGRDAARIALEESLNVSVGLEPRCLGLITTPVGSSAGRLPSAVA